MGEEIKGGLRIIAGIGFLAIAALVLVLIPAAFPALSSEVSLESVRVEVLKGKATTSGLVCLGAGVILLLLPRERKESK